MKTCLPLVAAITVASLVSAQEPHGGIRVTATGDPVYQTLDLDTGVIETLSAPSSVRGSSLCFDNSIDDDGYADVLLYPADDEIFDWGIKNCAGSQLVESIEIGYASMAPIGLNGALVLRIYEHATGFGNFGQLLREINLTGLPSDGPLPFGQCCLIPRYLRIDLGSQAFFLPPGQFGWSYSGPDGLTGPIIVDVVPSTGTQNFFDIYSPGPASVAGFVGTFTLPPGGSSNDPYENSFFLRLFQDNTQGSSQPFPLPPNPSILAASVPVVGSNLLVKFDLRSHPTTTLTAVVMTTQRMTGVRTSFGILGLDLNTSIMPISVQAGDSHNFNIPLNTAHIGLQLYAQGAIVAPGLGVRLTSGVDLFVGAF